MKAAAELGYRVNHVARSIRTGTTATLGALVADLRNPFFAYATRGIADRAKMSGYQVILVNTDEDTATERRGLDVLLGKRMDGLIIASTAPKDVSYLAAAQSSGTPLVLLDRKVPGIKADSVVGDNRAGAQQAMDAFVEYGHHRIAFVTAAAPPRRANSNPDGMAGRLISSAAERIQVYRRTMRTLGVTNDEYLRFAGYAEGSVRNAMAELLRRDDRPTAVLASDSVVAIEVMWAIRDAGLRIPDDISVVMCDDVPWAMATTPATAAVAQPHYSLGTCAVEVLLRRIAEPNAPIRSVRMPTGFHLRGSVGPVPPAGRRVRVVGALDDPADWTS